MKFRKKPVVIEAIQLKPGCGDTIFGIAVLSAEHSDGKLYMYIETLEGEMRADEGDWIIKGINGEFYPCKPDIFEKTYENVTETKKSPKVCPYCQRTGTPDYMECGHCGRIGKIIRANLPVK